MSEEHLSDYIQKAARYVEEIAGVSIIALTFLKSNYLLTLMCLAPVLEILKYKKITLFLSIFPGPTQHLARNRYSIMVAHWMKKWMHKPYTLFLGNIYLWVHFYNEVNHIWHGECPIGINKKSESLNICSCIQYYCPQDCHDTNKWTGKSCPNC